jgi:hypothetical protein
MARLIIRKKPKRKLSPEKEGRKIGVGGVVSVLPDGALCGKMVHKREWIDANGTEDGFPDEHLIVQISGLSVSKAQELLHPEVLQSKVLFDIDGNPIETIVSNRKWVVDIDEIIRKAPKEKKERIKSEGYLELTAKKAIGYILRKKTQEPIR